MMRAMERQQTGDARVIPILLRPVFLEDEPFIRLASLPTNGRPISMWRNRDEAFVDIARGISKSIKDLQTSSPSIPSVRRDPFRFANEVASYFTS